MNPAYQKKIINNVLGELRKGSCDKYCLELMREKASKLTDDQRAECLALARELFQQGHVVKEQPIKPEVSLPPPTVDNASEVSGDALAKLIQEARLAGLASAQKMETDAALIEESDLTPLVNLFEQLMGGSDGALTRINKTLAKQKRRQLKTIDVAFIAWVHHDSILGHEDGSSPTWRVVKRSLQHPFISKLTTDHAGKIFTYLMDIGFCKRTRDSDVKQNICVAYELKPNSLFDPLFTGTLAPRL